MRKGLSLLVPIYHCYAVELDVQTPNLFVRNPYPSSQEVLDVLASQYTIHPRLLVSYLAPT
jgi:hypothetical protein